MINPHSTAAYETQAIIGRPATFVQWISRDASFFDVRDFLHDGYGVCDYADGRLIITAPNGDRVRALSGDWLVRWEDRGDHIEIIPGAIFDALRDAGYVSP